MSKLTCPYCFEQFSFSEIEFRCLGKNPTHCAFEPDEELARYEKLSVPPMRGRIFKADGSVWRSLRKSVTSASAGALRCQCGERTWEVCPFCHHDLPTGFAEVKTKTIALIGAKHSGKSNYIAVLIHELFSDNVGAKFDSSIFAWDKDWNNEDTSKRYKDNFEQFVYGHNVVVPGTVSATAKTNRPLVFKFDVSRRASLFAGGRKRKRVSLMAFFDTAGEDLDNIDVMSTEAKYIANSDGIVLLLDPLQMAEVRDRLKGSVKLPLKYTEPIQIVGKTIELIQRFKGLSDQKANITIPLAVTFSKIDEILPLFDGGSPLKHASNHDGYFDITDAEIVSENIKAHLAKWEGGNMDRVLKNHFRTYSYFGLSALGASPEANGSIAFGAAPFRVVDPVLWILHRQGIIPGKRSEKR
jgi:GTPase SAR1 family protein